MAGEDEFLRPYCWNALVIKEIIRIAKEIGSFTDKIGLNGCGVLQDIAGDGDDCRGGRCFDGTWIFGQETTHTRLCLVVISWRRR